MIPTTEPALRIAKLFSRRITTAWAEKELRAYRKLYKRGYFAALDDLALIERYYAFERRKGDKGIHRRDLFTFLNNYAGELDRAIAWKANRKPDPTRYKATEGARPCSDKEFQRLGELAKAELERFKAAWVAHLPAKPDSIAE